MGLTAIEGINRKLYEEFRTIVAQRGITIKEALEEAIKLWIKQNTYRLTNKNVEGIIYY